MGSNPMMAGKSESGGAAGEQTALAARDEVWTAFRAGYLLGVSEPELHTYNEWCAMAEAGATAYVAVEQLRAKHATKEEK